MLHCYYVLTIAVTIFVHTTYGHEAQQNASSNKQNAENHSKSANTPKQAAEDAEPMAWEKSGQYEGDIVEGVNFRNGLRDLQARWYGGVVPYTFHHNVSWEERVKVQDALEVYCEKTCIIFRPKYAMETLRDFLVITNEANGCWSMVGKQGGPQQLNLSSRDCMTNVGNIRHEFMHALGFEHQHTDSNRDDYLTIYWDNIDEGREKNFRKHSAEEVTSFGEAYDYASIMHYSRYAFSKNNKTTMVPIRKGVKMGHAQELSPIDISKIKKMYNCKDTPEMLADYKREAKQMGMGTCAYRFFANMKSQGYKYF